MTDPKVAPNEDEISVCPNTLKSDPDQLVIRKKGGRFLLVAFTKRNVAVAETSGDDHLALVPNALRGLLIRQCRSGKVDFEELRRALPNC